MNPRDLGNGFEIKAVILDGTSLARCSHEAQHPLG